MQITSTDFNMTQYLSNEIASYVGYRPGYTLIDQYNSRSLIRILTGHILDSQRCKGFIPADNEDYANAQAELSLSLALRKHAYSNILKISPPKTESFQIKVLISFIFLLKT